LVRSLPEHLSNIQIEDYCRHKLSAAELFFVSNHLDACEACSRQIERALGGDAAFFALKSEAFGEEEMLFSPAGRVHLTTEQTAGYVDEVLEGEELQVVNDHLTSCQQCEAAVTDLQAFKDRIVHDIKREYQASSTVPEKRWRHVFADLPPRSPRLNALVFGSGLAVLLLILGGGLYWQALQRKETVTEIVPPTPGATPVVSPTPRSGDVSAVLAQLNDGGGQVTLDREGNLSGIDNLLPVYQQIVKGALTNQRLEKSPLLAGLTRPESSQVRGRENKDRNFSTINPVGILILSDRPTFRWSRLDGATSYVVEVYDNDFNRVAASSQLRDNSWTAPESLTRGKTYTWQVKANKDGQQFISPHPTESVAKFRILDRATADELKQAQRIYAGSHLTLGVLYARYGLLDDAVRELGALQKANPDSAIARRLLANVRAMRRSVTAHPSQSPSLPRAERSCSVVMSAAAVVHFRSSGN
jgi:hypothetical protein